MTAEYYNNADNISKGGFNMKIYEYPKCTTCKKALNFLDKKNIEYNKVNIKENPPSKEELTKYYKESGLPLKKFFNTSGLKYKELNLKEKLNEMSEDEQLELLVSDGMLIKRPLAVSEDFIFLGFKENEWEKIQ